MTYIFKLFLLYLTSNLSTDRWNGLISSFSQSLQTQLTNSMHFRFAWQCSVDAKRGNFSHAILDTLLHFYSVYSNNRTCYQEGKRQLRFKKNLVQHVLITVLIHYLTRHGSSKIFLSLVFIFYTCWMYCEVNNRLSSKQMWDKSGQRPNGNKPCHARTQL